MRDFRDSLTMFEVRRPLPPAFWLACMLLMASQVVFAATETPPEFDYPANLREVYGAYQAVLARRDACITAFPQQRAGTEKPSPPGRRGIASSSTSSTSASR